MFIDINTICPVTRILQHVTDVSNDAWRKQEAAVLRELATMVSTVNTQVECTSSLTWDKIVNLYLIYDFISQGLADKPIVTVWNKIDLAPERKEFLKFEVTAHNCSYPSHPSSE